MTYWNRLGVVGMIAALAAGIVTTRILVSLFGDYGFTKGVGFIVGGFTMWGLDMVLRLRSAKVEGANRLASGDCGGTIGLPMWIIGVVGIVGGITLMLGPEY